MKNSGSLQLRLANDREVILTRSFRARRTLVYDAFTKPEILERWFGPKGWTLAECEVDLRIGGGFRFVLLNPSGRQLTMRGQYRELQPPSRSVHTEAFEGFPGESLVTSVLTESEDGCTTLVATIAYPSVDARDAAIRAGMEHGAAGSYDKLAAWMEGASR